MQCRRCDGRVFLDRVYSDNKNYEIYCIICGDRRFVKKESTLGYYLYDSERKLRAERGLSG